MNNRAISSCLSAIFVIAAASAFAADHDRPDHGFVTATPIKHLVVIFQENISFDHYFGTYPVAQNNPGETPFYASKDTPKNINTLLNPLDVDHHFRPLASIDLLHKNPNSLTGTGMTINGKYTSNPFRLTPAQALTSDENHNYLPEQQAYDNGKMDAFPHYTGVGGVPSSVGPRLAMGYYDGNTVTALWNYAQHFAMNDNSYTTVFGPSTPGAIDVVSGQTNGFDVFVNVVDASGKLLHTTHEVRDGNGNFTDIGDADPYGDVCSTKTGDTITMHGRNIGDLLNAKGITWGAFMGGFDLSVTNANGTSGCKRASALVVSPTSIAPDYMPHHAWFQYYASTRNLTHARPRSVAAIGHTRDPETGAIDPANHQYDLHDFFDALKTGNLPAVSYLKAKAIEDAHPGYSDPIDEQNFVVKVINALQQSPDWASTAVIVTYDDSDGWYDHQMPPIVNPSFTTVDALNGSGVCKVGLQQERPATTTPLKGAFGKAAQGRCGYGTRIPLLVISPFAKVNYVDHTLTDQSSIIKFIEDNWLAGERIQIGGSFDTVAGALDNMFDFGRDEKSLAPKLILNPATGTRVR